MRGKNPFGRTGRSGLWIPKVMPGGRTAGSDYSSVKTSWTVGGAEQETAFAALKTLLCSSESNKKWDPPPASSLKERLPAGGADFWAPYSSDRQRSRGNGGHVKMRHGEGYGRYAAGRVAQVPAFGTELDITNVSNLWSKGRVLKEDCVGVGWQERTGRQVPIYLWVIF